MPASDDPDETNPNYFVRRNPLLPRLKLCPRCLSPLTLGGKLGGWLLPQDYICNKCGYTGTVFLEGTPDIDETEKR